MKRIVWTVATILAVIGSTVQGGEIGFVERFALATDRQAALQQLIPGTEDFYYYSCLHLQNTEQYARVDQLLTAWIKRFNYTPRVKEIRVRQALLTYPSNPEKSLEFIRNELNLKFNHQRATVGTQPDLPTRLDPSLFDRVRLLADALRRHKNLDGFESPALDWLVAEKLDPDRRRFLLQRLTRPDYPNLEQLVIDDLNYKNSRGFGAVPIHGLLLLSQLDTCLKLKPDLINNTKFVTTYVNKLYPNDDVDIRHDRMAQSAYLNRVWKFVSRLSPTFNSLKLHVLYHRLVLDRSLGTYDKSVFMQYIGLPRQATYMNPKFIGQVNVRRFAGELKADFGATTKLPPVGNDEPLIRSYLQHFFVDETTYAPYETHLNDQYLKRQFAETKIVNGLGDGEKWASWLSPESYQSLKDRVDLDFSRTNADQFLAGEPVGIDLLVKNVPTMIVKVYRINTDNFYRQNGREVNTDINLDGLVPNEEATYEYEDPPLRRTLRHFDFPQLSQAGVYVVDFIGNGKSSRAVIRKGRLQYWSRISTAGHVITVLNDRKQLVPGASIWLDGHQYTTDKDQTITIPFSTRPGNRSIVISDGKVSSLDSFAHQSENYQLAAGFYVDRESLLMQNKSTVVIRPGLYLNGTPVTLSVLKNVRLSITSTDRDGVNSTKDVPGFELYEDRESVYTFQVPARLSTIAFRLTAQVRNLSLNKEVDLAAGQSFPVNGIDATDKVQDLHLLRIGSEYRVELLGKTGEPRGHLPIQFDFKHRDFKHPISLTMQTDKSGTVVLGPLTDIVQLTAEDPTGTSHTWTLRDARHSHSRTLHAAEGSVVQVPYMGTDKQPQRSEFSLLEVHGTQYVKDRFADLRIQDGMLKMVGLTAGDYDLLFKPSGPRIRIRITAGEVQKGHILGNSRQLELRGQHPLQIDSVTVDAKTVDIHLRNADKFTRLHVFGTRYEPEFWVYDYLGRLSDREPILVRPGWAGTMYVAGRKIGDEYRYILDRKYARKFPGNMLQRPSMLLNPWALRKTEAGRQEAADGEAFESEPTAPASSRESMSRTAGQSKQAGTFPNLDFLAEGSALLLNLTPDKEGHVTLDRRALGPHQRLWIVAIDPNDTACRGVSLSPGERRFRDLRLPRSLNVETHFTQQKQVNVLATGDVLKINDIASARFESYDSLSKVYGLFTTLSKDATLAEFSFVLDWNTLKADQKREKYSKYACHELNFFLSRKDPAFFQTVVRPYLKQKLDATFLDNWLTNADLGQYLEPWRYAQLNVVERILLGRRLAAERPYTMRHIRDLHELIPIDVDRESLLFESAVAGRALDTNVLFNRRRVEALGVVRLNADTPALAQSLQKAAGFGSPRPAAGAPEKPAERDSSASGRGELKAKSPSLKLGAMFRGGRKADGKKSAAEFYESEARRRKDAKRLYLKTDSTKEWAENNYYQLPIEKQDGNLIAVSAFWREYAAHDPKQPFYSGAFAEASRSFTEMMFALAVLDLPARSPEHAMTFDQATMRLETEGPVIAFHEEIKPAAMAAEKTPVLVSQNFFQQGDRYRYENNQKTDKYVEGEFLVNTVYGCQIVVTNPTSSDQKLSLLIQVPQGAMPVLNGHMTRTVPVRLEPFHTSTFEYFFYFPSSGAFSHYPVQVAKDQKIVAFAPPVELEAVAELTKIDRTSWDYLSQFGSNGEVLTYLENENLGRVKLDRIAFRMQDKEFFQETVARLARRHVYDHTLWSYSIRHDLPDAIRVYLQHAEAIVREAGRYLQSPLLTLDPVERRTYQHLDYRPLINARAHQLGRQRQIVNKRLLQQYQRLLSILAYKATLDNDDLMALTYYMLLQDRTEEAMRFFARVRADRLHTRLQYDYFTAYLDFYQEEPKAARRIARQYADYSVDRWRNAFAAIQAQLDEIAGGEQGLIDPDDRDQSQTRLAASEPEFDFEVEAKKISINYQKVRTVRINYYLMDIELLFSRNPFVQQYSNQFSTIHPNVTTQVTLPAGKKSYQVALPKTLHNSNVLIEIRAAGKTRSRAYYANSLSVHVSENYGQLRVTESSNQKALGAVYVKAYARMKDGSIRFYKDGYTDLRGRFDYSSLNTNELDSVAKFSLLISSDERGAVIREADPPRQ